MFHNASEFETRAREAERLAGVARDPVLREDLLGLARIYRDYASHLLHRGSHPADAAWRKAVRS